MPRSRSIGLMRGGGEGVWGGIDGWMDGVAFSMIDCGRGNIWRVIDI